MRRFGNKPPKPTAKELTELVKKWDQGDKEAGEQVKSFEKSFGTGEKQVAKIRIALYTQAAYKGDRQARYWLGVSQARLGNREASLEWLTNLARDGEVGAMRELAKGYAKGGCYGYRKEEYRYWIQKAAQEKDAWAQAKLGQIYEGKDGEKARYWFTQSAKQDCAAGLIGLGKSFYNEAMSVITAGEETKRKEKLQRRAEVCFLRALDTAQKGREFAQACHELGVLYEFALPGKAFAEKAAYFYYRAWKGLTSRTDGEAFERIRNQYGLQTDEADLEAWEKRIFGEEV